MRELSIVVVTYESAAVIGECLDACLRAAPEGIVVVDNASADATGEQVARRPAAGWIGNRQNRGFAAAVNQGVRATTSPLILLLNPDAVLHAEGLDALIAAFSDPRVGAAAGRLADADGKAQSGFTVRRLPTPWALGFETLGLNRVWPGNPVNRRYRCLDLDLEREQDVEQPAGAFLAFRREVWSDLAGFDECFHPVWFEDVDFCRRLLERGWRVRYVPAAGAKHRGGHSVFALAQEQRTVYWYANLLRYSAKHFGRWSSIGVCLATILGLSLRSMTGMVFRRGRVSAATWSGVVGLALGCIVRGRVAGPEVRGTEDRSVAAG